jgi:hypothetical protein
MPPKKPPPKVRYIPKTALYKLKRGEVVLPRTAAEKLLKKR